MATMALVSIFVTTWLGSMFIYSASLKLVRYEQAATIVRPYGILPPGLDRAAGLLLPWAELLGGMLLLSWQFFPVGPLLGAVLGICFVYGSLKVLRRGAAVPCGCAGADGERVNRTTLVRALLITACSLFVLSVAHQGSERLPILVGAPLALGLLFPAGLSLWRRPRRACPHRRLARRDQAEITRLLRLLADPPGAPVTNHLAPGTPSLVSSTAREEVIVQRKPLVKT